MDPDRAERIQQETEDEIKRAGEYTLHFQQDVDKVANIIAGNDPHAAMRRAARQLKQAQDAYDHVSAFLTKTPIKRKDAFYEGDDGGDDDDDGGIGAGGECDGEDGLGGESSEVVSSRSAARWWAKLLKTIQDLITNGFDKLFVEVKAFVEMIMGKDGSGNDELRNKFTARVEEEEAEKIIRRQTHPLERLEAQLKRRGPITATITSAAERLEADVEILKGMEYANESENVQEFIQRADDALVGVFQRQTAQETERRRRKKDAELKKYRDAVYKVMSEADLARRQLDATMKREQAKIDKDLKDAFGKKI